MCAGVSWYRAEGGNELLDSIFSDHSPRGIAPGRDRRVQEWRRRCRPRGSPQSVARQQVAGPATLRVPGSPQSGQAKQGEPSVTSPARPIDTKQLTETVKEEVKGGEASEGPTPFAYLWSAAEARADQGRAASRQGSDRPAAAHCRKSTFPPRIR